MTETILVASSLVQYLRRGVRSRFGFAADRLAVCLLEFNEDPAEEYEQSLQLFQVAHKLYDQLKSAGDQPPSDIEIDITSNAELVLKALECQYSAKLDRLQEVALYGGNREDGDSELRALADLIEVVKRHVRRQERDNAHGRQRKQTLTGHRSRR